MHKPTSVETDVLVSSTAEAWIPVQGEKPCWGGIGDALGRVWSVAGML